jgi:hypothetical protein
MAGLGVVLGRPDLEHASSAQSGGRHRLAAVEVRPVAPTLENGGQATIAQVHERR